MSRILLTWELGLNLGHLARLLPVVQQLKAMGHTVLVATRDIQAAATLLTPAAIPFVQAPYLPKGIALAHRPAGFADILLSQGWSDRGALRGLTHAWLNLLRLFNPDRLILDYSPTVSLAARIARIPTTQIGNGFELPPRTAPLPCFSGFSWSTPARAAGSEAIAIANANPVLTSYAAQPVSALCELLRGNTRLLATFPELDHYGTRSDSVYIGPLLGQVRAPRVSWPEGAGPRIFACLRPDTSHVQLILSALAGMSARVICVAPGFAPAQLQKLAKDSIRLVAGPVDLLPLGDADLCVTYGAEGTMLRFLSAGVPQIISPWHVETYMAGRRMEACGVGALLPDEPTEPAIAAIFHAWAGDRPRRDHVASFARRQGSLTLEQVACLALGESPSATTTRSSAAVNA